MIERFSWRDAAVGAGLTLVLSIAVCWSFLLAPEVQLPTEQSSLPGQPVLLKAQTKAQRLAWIVSDPSCELLEVGDPRTVLLIPKQSGTLRIAALSGGLLGPSVPAVTTLYVGPRPEPSPPTPPTPPRPQPRGDGYLLIVYDAAKSTTLSAEQQRILYSNEARQLYDRLCASESGGMTKAWRIFPEGLKLSEQSALWQKLYQSERSSLPWLYLHKDGMLRYSGPLPETWRGMEALLKEKFS